MDAATAIKIAKEARKMAKKVKELYELDQNKRVVVKQNIILGRFHQAINFPDGSIRSVPDFLCDDFGIIDGVFEVFATGDRKPFCDGSSLAPDKVGSWNTIKAALGHDAGYEHLEEIAEAWGWKVEDVRWLFDAMFGNLLNAETERQTTVVMRVAGNALTRVYYWAVRRFGGFYHAVKQRAPVILALLFFAGCLAIPDVFEPSEEQPEVTESQQGKTLYTDAEKPGGQHEVESGSADSHAETSHAGQGAEGEVADLGAVEWKKCKYSSNWSGSNASKRMMNLVSPKFSDSKVKEYLDWQVGIGCDHVHLLLVNQADGEGAGYDALADSSAHKTALKRVQQIRARGLGVVAWVVADDSDGYRQKIFADPAKYAAGLKDFMPYISYIVLGLEMNEGEGSSAKWKSLCDAIKTAGWTGPFATHHTSGKTTHASLGSIVMDQLEPSCTTADIAKSVKALKGKGYEVNGFEYSRGPDAAKAKAALDAGAFSCGNWKGSGPVVAPAPANDGQMTQSADEVDFSALNWSWGGFNGKNAKPVEGVEIGSLKVSGNLTYKWVRGGCEKLGATSREDADHTICALFCKLDGKWQGGKFDWISTSRLSRDFKNVREGYGGWRKDAIEAAEAYAFVICSKDGKRRSNVAMFAK